MWEAVTGKSPFGNLMYGEVIERVILRGERPVFPDDTPADYRQLAEDCWKTEPHDRPTFEMVVHRLEAMMGIKKELSDICSGGFALSEVTQGGSGGTSSSHSHGFSSHSHGLSSNSPRSRFNIHSSNGASASGFLSSSVTPAIRAQVDALKPALLAKVADPDAQGPHNGYWE